MRRHADKKSCRVIQWVLPCLYGSCGDDSIATRTIRTNHTPKSAAMDVRVSNDASKRKTVSVLNVREAVAEFRMSGALRPAETNASATKPDGERGSKGSEEEESSQKPRRSRQFSVNDFSIGRQVGEGKYGVFPLL